MSESRRAGEAPEMTHEQEVEFYGDVRRQLLRMLDLLQQEAPDIIMASEVSTLWWRYVGKCPVGMRQSWFDDMISEALRRNARCDLCGTSIPPAVTHVPVCTECDKELDELDRLIADEPV